jgi:hypothetical protein
VFHSLKCPQTTMEKICQVTYPPNTLKELHYLQNVRCLPNIIKNNYECFTNNGVEGKRVVGKYLSVPSSPTICIVCLTFRKRNR